jgi:hypothetical protein
VIVTAPAAGDSTREQAPALVPASSAEVPEPHRDGGPIV